MQYKPALNDFKIRLTNQFNLFIFSDKNTNLPTGMTHAPRDPRDLPDL